MQRKNISFEQLWDIIAFRIITNNIEGYCFNTIKLNFNNPSVVELSESIQNVDFNNILISTVCTSDIF